MLFMGLFSSWATPAVRVPTARILWDCTKTASRFSSSSIMVLMARASSVNSSR